MEQTKLEGEACYSHKDGNDDADVCSFYEDLYSIALLRGVGGMGKRGGAGGVEFAVKALLESIYVK
ncbi:hypothetical protein Ancab_028695 [Ancistrocladus abbreviatus]